ncbi:MAG TPA: tetratricopeptide repeat protein [Myxococcota bacterium]|nr:tetratricopeptide repeat protein [Myxococcota bacterium]HQK51904.1 tetratricopeptide repeat protein [Myxococcota bacterium]
MAFRGARVGGWWLVMFLGLTWPLGALQAEEFGNGDLVAQVIEGCPRQPDPAAYQALERKILGALSWAMRRGEVRDVLAAAEALESCRRRQPRTQDFDPADTPALIREVHCFLPLVLFEQQHQVDDGMARRGLQICPEPPDRPPEGADEKAVRRWAERVRRHLLLSAMVGDPAEVLSRAMARIEALRQTGLWKEMVGAEDGGTTTEEDLLVQDLGAAPSGEEGEEGESSGEAGGEAPATEEPAEADRDDEEEFPGTSGIQNPLMTARVLATAAALATGRSEDLARALGGDQALCKSPLLEGMTLIQRMLPFQTPALRLAQNRLLSPAVTGPIASLVEDLARRFPGKDCPTPGALALLALQSLSPEQVAVLVRRGETPRLAGLWRRVDDTVPVIGTAADRLVLLEALARGPEFPGQSQRRCEWARTLIEGGMAREALEVLEAGGFGAECGRSLRVWAWGTVEKAAGKGDDRGTSAIQEWLQPPPEPEEVLRLLQEATPEEVQRYLIDRLGRHVVRPGTPVAQRKAVIRALVKLVDKAPGTSLAGAALAWARKARGWAENPGEEVMLDLIATRHFLEAGRETQARGAYRSALARVRPSMEETVSALWVVTIQLLRERHDGWVREGRARLMAVPPSDPMMTSAAAVELARRGMRDLAITVMRHATDQTLRTGGNRETLADTWLLLNRPEEARRVIAGGGTAGTGAEASDLLRARQAMAEKDYRKALGILGLLLDQDPGNTDLRYQRALARMLAGRAEEAEVDLRTCLRESPGNPMVLGALAYAQFDQGHYDEAEPSFRAALAIDDQEPDNLLGLALTLFRLGRLEEAREIWTSHLKGHPLFQGGVEAAEAAGYSYSDIQKQAWREFQKALASPDRDRKPGR